MISLFFKDFDRYSLSQTYSIMEKILNCKSYHSFIEKEEQNLPWNSYQVDK